MSWTPRRVVTGHDGNGKSVVISDGAPPVQTSVDDYRISFFELWNTNAAPTPVAATEPEPTERPLKVPPEPQGTIIRVNEFRPGSVTPMHRTETIDYGIVLEGEMVLVLDDSEVELGAGNVVVQRGTDHRWENRSDGVARMAFVLVDGAFAPELEQLLGPDALAHVMRGPLEA
jgi:naringenin degradation protein FdeH